MTASISTSQPIVTVTDHESEAEHYELLVRMEDEQGNLVMPDVFLPAAERYNLSGWLDRWVISTAFAWFADRPASLQRLFLCAINISGHSLGDENFLAFVEAQFKKYRIPAEKFCFEITETVAITNLADAAKLIQSLQGVGLPLCPGRFRQRTLILCLSQKSAGGFPEDRWYFCQRHPG